MRLRVPVRQLHGFVGDNPTANLPLRPVHIFRRERHRTIGRRLQFGQRKIERQLHGDTRTRHDVFQNGKIIDGQLVRFRVCRRLNLGGARADRRLRAN